MYGWGRLLPFMKDQSEVSTTVVIGLGLVLFIGGILNSLHLANEVAIKIVFFVGLASLLARLFPVRYKPKESLRRFFANRSHAFLTLSVVGLIALISAVALVPEAYNFHDDYQKYFVYPVKMLSTGSANGSSLSAIGRETFGGQAFFQAFFVSWLGLKAINIFDSVFCLVIVALLLIEQGRKYGAPLFGLLVAGLLVLIHPQYVNVSSLYSAVLFMATAAILMAKLTDHVYRTLSSFYVTIFALSLCFAALVALKASYGIFPAFYFFFAMSLTWILREKSRNLTIVTLTTPLLSVVFALPWMIPTLVRIFLDNTTNTPLEFTIDNSTQSIVNWFSTDSLFYGATLMHYTGLVVLGILSIIVFWYQFRREIRSGLDQNVGYAISGCAALLAGIAAFILIIQFVSPVYFDLGTAIRYAIPFLIGSIPAGLLLVYISISTIHHKARLALAILVTISGASFAQPTVQRITQGVTCGSQLSFKPLACNPNYIDYNKEVLDGDRRQLTLQWQQQIPKGAAFMAWINTPFYLDFKRNMVLEIDIAGLDNPWASFPSAEYLLWDHGFATRPIPKLQQTAQIAPMYDRRNAIRALQLLNKMTTMSNNGGLRVVYKDREAVLFKLQKDDKTFGKGE